MENINTPSRKKTYAKLLFTAGVIGGLLMALPSYLSWIFNTQIFSNSYISFFYGVLILGAMFVVFGKRVAENSDPTGENGYDYSKAYGFAILMSLIAGFVSAIPVWMLFSYIAPEYATELLDHAAENVANVQGATEQSIAMGVKLAKMMLTLPGLLFGNIFGTALYGGLVGLITSAIVKRNPKI